jgi:hypothetical protein
MELFTLLASCAAVSLTTSAPAVTVNDLACQQAQANYQRALTGLKLSPLERDAIGRVAYAEAANQGDSGLTAVVYTLLNRLISGQFGNSVVAIVNAPKQFEPVTKAGGWQNLPPLKPDQQAKIDTMVNLALAGYLPDPTNGALFFQNPAIVAKREQAGSVTKGMTHFGGATPSAVIQDHAFYPQIKAAVKVKQLTNKVSAKTSTVQAWDIYQRATADQLTVNSSWQAFAGKPAKNTNIYNQ